MEKNSGTKKNHEKTTFATQHDPIIVTEKPQEEAPSETLPNTSVTQDRTGNELPNNANHVSEVEALVGSVEKLGRTTIVLANDPLGSSVVEDECSFSRVGPLINSGLKPLSDISNVGCPLTQPVQGRKWKKLARESGVNESVEDMVVDDHCRPTLEVEDMGASKKKRVVKGTAENKENFQVAQTQTPRNHFGEDFGSYVCLTK
nr:hypothetical protein CFP56_45098 [Quercus suber]